MQLLFASNDDGVQWQFQFVDQSQTLNSAVWANGLYVAVGYEGDVVTTPDGISCTLHTSASTNDLFDIAWNGSRFVAVGDGVIQSSEDGENWTFRSDAASGRLESVAWGNGLFVAVGESSTGGSGLTMTSGDGILWTVTQDPTLPLLAIDWAENHFYLSYADGLLRGTDGISWEEVIDETGSDFRGVAESNGLFVVVGDRITCTSDDGAAWTCTEFTPSTLSSVVAGRDRFFAVSREIYSSIDGINWIESLDADLFGLASSGFEVVAVGFFGGVAVGDIESIFTDGFENGDTSAWSAEVPVPTPTQTPTPDYTPTFTPTHTPTVVPTATDTPAPASTPTVTYTPTRTATPVPVINCSLVTVTNLEAQDLNYYTATITNGLTLSGPGQPPYLQIKRTVWTWHPASQEQYVDYFSVNSRTSSPSNIYWVGDSFDSTVDAPTSNWDPPTLNISGGGSAQWYVDLDPNLQRPAGTYQLCLDFEVLNTTAPVTECLNVCASYEFEGDPPPDP